MKAPEVLNGCEVLLQQKLLKYPGKGQGLQGVSCQGIAAGSVLHPTLFHVRFGIFRKLLLSSFFS